MSPSELWNLCLILLALGALMGLSEWLRKRELLPVEYTRKLVHLGSGVVVYFLPVAFESHWPVLGLALLFLAITALSQRFGALRSVHGVERNSVGAWVYPITVYGLFLLTRGNALLFQVPMLILAFSDAFGALVGKTYGMVKYRVMDQIRSLEGSTAFFVVAFLATHIPLLLSAQTGRWEAVLISFVIALLATFFEAVSLGGSDNLLVPVGVYFLFQELLPMGPADLEFRALVLLVLLLLVLVSSRWQGLSTSGAIGAVLAGYVVWTVGGLNWFLPGFFFYMTFNLLERLPAFSRPRLPQEADPKVREVYQISAVFYISLPMVAWVFVQRLFPEPAVFAAFLVAVCGSSAISWGTLSSSRWLRGLRPVRLARNATHDSGMLLESLGALAATVVGGGLPLAAFLIVAPAYPLSTAVTWLALAGGMLALGIKALLGTTLRVRYLSEGGVWEGDRPILSGNTASLVGGFPWWTTDRCHLLAVGVASLLGFLLMKLL